MIDKAEWEWFGSARHLIVAAHCRFHLCTLIGEYIVSTVGEYFPDEGVREIHAQSLGIKLKGRGDEREYNFMRKVGFIEIGYGRKYETMVFKWSGQRCTGPDCMCGLPMVEEWSELDFGGYNTAGDATRGHMALCEKWAAI